MFEKKTQAAPCVSREMRILRALRTVPKIPLALWNQEVLEREKKRKSGGS